MSLRLLASFFLLGLSPTLWANPLSHCSAQFIGGDINNAPTLFSSAPDVPFAENVHLCYRDDGDSFFAIEYRPVLSS